MYNEEDIRNKQIYHQNTGCFIFSEESTSVFSSMAQNMVSNHNHHEQPPKIKKKRNLPGNPGTLTFNLHSPPFFSVSRWFWARFVCTSIVSPVVSVISPSVE